jgi:hypothetical protein
MENVACAGTGAKEPKGKQPPCRLTPLGNSTSHAHLHVGSEKRKPAKPEAVRVSIILLAERVGFEPTGSSIKIRLL